MVVHLLSNCINLGKIVINAELNLNCSKSGQLLSRHLLQMPMGDTNATPMPLNPISIAAIDLWAAKSPPSQVAIKLWAAKSPPFLTALAVRPFFIWRAIWRKKPAKHFFSKWERGTSKQTIIYCVADQPSITRSRRSVLNLKFSILTFSRSMSCSMSHEQILCYVKIFQLQSMTSAIKCIDQRFAFKNSGIACLTLIFNLSYPRSTILHAKRRLQFAKHYKYKVTVSIKKLSSLEQCSQHSGRMTQTPLGSGYKVTVRLIRFRTVK